MKKISVGIVLCIILTLLVGCSKSTTVSKNVNSSNKKAKETTDPNYVPKPQQITDEAVLDGLSDDLVESMSLEEKVGQLFIVSLESLDDSKGNCYEYREATEKMLQSVQDYGVGGIALFSRNIETRDQVKKLIADLQSKVQTPLFVSVDEEGGSVSRIASNPNMQTTVFPTMEVIGATKDSNYAYKMGKTIGKEIRQLGFNVDFAPVADVKTNNLNTEIGDRSFGSDASICSDMVRGVVKGLTRQGIVTTLKHFPGQGATDGDSHEGSVNLNSDIDHLREVEFKPFESGIDAGVDMVMVSHISISRVTADTIPATLSSFVVDDLLRKELGFEGVVITDAMDMKSITNTYTADQAAIQAVKAGCNIILMPQNFDQAYHTIINAVNSGDISEDRINDSVKRILRLKIRRGIIQSGAPILKRVK